MCPWSWSGLERDSLPLEDSSRRGNTSKNSVGLFSLWRIVLFNFENKWSDTVKFKIEIHLQNARTTNYSTQIIPGNILLCCFECFITTISQVFSKWSSCPLSFTIYFQEKISARCICTTAAVTLTTTTSTRTSWKPSWTQECSRISNAPSPGHSPRRSMFRFVN